MHPRLRIADEYEACLCLDSGYHTCLLLDVSGCRRAGWWRRAVQLHQAYGLMVMSLTRHTGGHYELYASTSPTKLNVQA